VLVGWLVAHLPARHIAAAAGLGFFLILLIVLFVSDTILPFDNVTSYYIQSLLPCCVEIFSRIAIDFVLTMYIIDLQVDFGLSIVISIYLYFSVTCRLYLLSGLVSGVEICCTSFPD
jgi:hypothetical protein